MRARVESTAVAITRTQGSSLCRALRSRWRSVLMRNPRGRLSRQVGQLRRETRHKGLDVGQGHIFDNDSILFHPSICATRRIPSSRGGQILQQWGLNAHGKRIFESSSLGRPGKLHKLGSNLGPISAENRAFRSN